MLYSPTLAMREKIILKNLKNLFPIDFNYFYFYNLL